MAALLSLTQSYSDDTSTAESRQRGEREERNKEGNNKKR